MNESVEELFIRLGYDLKAFQASSRQVDDTIEKTVNKASIGFKGLFNTIATGFGLKVLGQMVTQFGETGRRIDFLSQRFSASTQELQLFEQAARRTGSSVEGLDNAFESIFMKIQNARQGQGGNFLPLLQSLGVNPANAKGEFKTPSQLLLDIGQAEYQQRNRKDLPFINSQLGIDPGIARLFAMQPDKLQGLLGNVQNNGILSKQDLANAEEAANVMNELSQSLTTLKNTLLIVIEPLVKLFSASTSFTSRGVSAIKGIFTGDTAPARDILSTASKAFSQDFKLLVGSPDLPKNAKFLNPFAMPDNLPNTIKQVNNAVPSLSKYVNQSRYYPSSNNSLANAQAIKESSYNPNAIGGYNESEKTYGLYQFRLSTARDVARKLGIKDQITAQSLLNPELNKKLRDRYLDDFTNKAYDAGLSDPRDIDKASLAGFNGGQAGFNYYLKKGKTFNYYGEDILHSDFSAANMNPANNVNNSTSNKNTTVNIQSMSLNGVNNPGQFMNQLNSKLQSAYSFQSNELA